jgi:DNA-binding transcriptional LysR family regulator
MIDHRLQVLRSVEAHGTVTAAAASLGYTPSAVSHQLRTLARDLGVTLLLPDGRNVRLTPAARLLSRRAPELQALWEDIRGEVATQEGVGLGQLRLAGFSTAAAALLPPVVARVGARHPRSTFRIIEADPEVCFALLDADEADVAVVVATASLPPSTDPRYEQRHLLDDPLDVLLPLSHPLAGRRSVPLRALADERWVLDRPGRPHHQLVLTACAEAGFVPTVAHEASEWDTGAALVAAGLAVALVPRLARVPGGEELTRVRLEGDPSPARHVLTAVRRGSSGQPEISAALAALTSLAAAATRL